MCAIRVQSFLFQVRCFRRLQRHVQMKTQTPTQKTRLESSSLLCDHCMLPVTDRDAVYDDHPAGRKVFCCRACNAIYRMIQEEGFGDFYRKRYWSSPGIPEVLKSGGESADVAQSGEPGSADFIREDGDIREADLVIDGIRCASCIWLNELVLERTEGVISARINFATHRAVVRWDSKTINLARILSRLRSIGYVALPYSVSAHDEALQRQGRDLLIRLGTAFFFSMQLMLYSIALYAGFFQGIDPMTKKWLEAAAFGVSTPVLFYSGGPFLAGAWRGIRNRALNMDVLISIGALAAYGVSIAHMLFGGEVYFDTAAMIITLVLLGRYLEHAARRSASQAVGKLLSLQPREARVVRGAERRMVPVSEVVKGDHLEVRPGERIARDGTVLEGVSEADESLVTGESKPVDKEPGSSVIGGTMNGLGVLLMEVTRTGQETVLAQIIRLVENAQSAAAPIQRLADRVSAYFIPVILAVAAATFGYWSMQGGGNSAAAMLSAVSVLVIACPCALGLATPVAILAGTGRAARRGILIKGGDVLERMRAVRVVVFDKTGTLTTGKMGVEEVWSVGSKIGMRNAECGVRNEERESELLQLAASAEQASEHLLGAAIVNHAKDQGVELLPAGDFRALPGQGVRATVDGKRIFVGKKEMLGGEGVHIPSDAEEAAQQLEEQGMTVVFVARAGKLIGYIALMDAPRSEASATVNRFKKLGMDVMMITGDNEATAHVVASGMGIEKVLAGVLPGGKADAVRQIRRQGKAVAMVGDGINDAPALAAADVGIAMSSGSDVAIESAGVVLVRRDLETAVEAFEISRKTLRIIKQNLFWAFFYNVAAVPLAVSGMLVPVVAAAAMVVSSVSVVTNSLRAR
jgi:P-type Cu2+ transporter